MSAAAAAAGTEAVCRLCLRPIRLTRFGWGHVEALRRPRHYATPRKEAAA